MTDLLIRDPNDTGDIPTVDSLAGEDTRNLAPYVNGLAPALRRPSAVLHLIDRGGCRRIDPDDDDFVRPGEVAPQPAPSPQPEPAPEPDSLWQEAPVVRMPRGRHRRPSRWDWLTTPLSAAVQIIRAAIR